VTFSSAASSEDSEVNGINDDTSGMGQQQRWIGLSGPIDGLSRLVDGLFIFLFFSKLFTVAGKQNASINT